MSRLGIFLAVSFAVGIADVVVFWSEALVVGSSEGQLAMVVAALLWVGILGVAIGVVRWRAAWLLLSLPLVLAPFGLLILGGMMD